MSQTSIKIIVFDLVGVLFFVNKIRVLRSLDTKDLFFYYLKKGKNPIEEGIMLLDKMRQEVPGQFQEIVGYKGTYLPNCFLQWNQGFISREEAFEQIQTYFNDLGKQNYFSNENHKRVILNLVKKLFSSSLGIEAYKPVRSTVELVKKLKKTNNYKLYILSNIDKETFEGMYELHKSIFNLFDGIVTSCYSNFLKPDSAIFEYLLKQYDLDPLLCCFIDDQIENLNAAQKFGMQTIHCTKPSRLPVIFKETGLL